MRRSIKMGLIVAALSAAVTFTAIRGLSQGSDQTLKDLGLADFAQTEMTYDGVMHELYWHYEFANQMIRVGRIDDAKAHLKMLSFYVNLLPYLSREKKFFKDPEAVKKFDTYATDMIAIVDKMGKSMGANNADDMGSELQKRVAYLCYHCHKDLKTPIREVTPYGKKIEMGPGAGQPEGKKRIHR